MSAASSLRLAAPLRAVKRHSALSEVREAFPGIILAAQVYSTMPWSWIWSAASVPVADFMIACVQARAALNDPIPTAHFVSLMALSVGIDEVAATGDLPAWLAHVRRKDLRALAMATRAEAYRKLEGYGERRVLDRVARVIEHFIKPLHGYDSTLEMLSAREGGFMGRSS